MILIGEPMRKLVKERSILQAAIPSDNAKEVAYRQCLRKASGDVGIATLDQIKRCHIDK